MDMTVLIAVAVAIGALFGIVIPFGILSAAFVISRREARRPLVRLCRAVDVDDPSAEPCWAPEGSDYCERHR